MKQSRITRQESDTFWDHVDDVLTQNEQVMTRNLKNRVSAKRALNNDGIVTVKSCEYVGGGKWQAS